MTGDPRDQGLQRLQAEALERLAEAAEMDVLVKALAVPQLRGRKGAWDRIAKYLDRIAPEPHDHR